MLSFWFPFWGQLKHGIVHNGLADRSQAAQFVFHGSFSNEVERLSLNSTLIFLHLKKPLILLQQGRFGFSQRFLRAQIYQADSGMKNGQTRPINSGIKPWLFKSELIQIEADSLQHQLDVTLWVGKSPMNVFNRAANKFRDASNAPPQMNRIFSVFTVIIFWSGCLRPPCGWNVDWGSFQ